MRTGSRAADAGFKAEGLIEVVRGLGYRGLGFRVASFRLFGVWGMRESGGYCTEGGFRACLVGFRIG